MKQIKLALLVFAVCTNLFSQNYTGVLNPNPERLLAPNSVNILAVMVEFPEDKDDATFGNGKFGSIYSQDYGSSILDPLPHDINYFSDHLSFAADYFSKVSGGKCTVSFDILDSVLTVSKPMRQYSPGNNSDDFTPLAEFAQEVWQMADVSNTGWNFSKYNLFVIFHAGVGREFALPGSIGNERDLPSIYMNEKSLTKSFGSDFDGFPVMNGAFNIQNSLILPETESREQKSLGETSLVELTTNGLIVASIGSFLGLPDLFNTETGRSAIGRFGLMDPQSFFAYRGLFPPEPSAWEKIFLGWIEPILLSPGGQYLTTLTAYAGAVGNDISVVKIPINSTEYFLVENRKRDALKNGSLPVLSNNGSLKQYTFDNDVDGYQSFAVDSIDGVLVGLDEYDWALPGFELNDKEGDPFEDIGLLIWHIDESIINAKLASNSINNDPDRKGVALLEADGIQEVGEVFETLFGTEIAEGSKEDTWYQGNPAKRYKNKLTAETLPSSNSNTGAYSYISIENISSIDVDMSFNTLFLNNELRQVKNSKLSTGLAPDFITHASFGDAGRIFINDGSNLVSMDETGTVKKNIADFGNVRPAAAVVNDTYFIVATFKNNFTILKTRNNIDEFITVNAGSKFTSEPVASSANGADKILAGAENGKIYECSLVSGFPIDSLDYFSTPVEQVMSSGNLIAASSGKILKDNFGHTYALGADIKFLSSSDLNTSDKILVALDSDDNLYVLANSQIQSKFHVNSINGVESFSIASLFGDGNNYILLTNGNKIEAYNFSGASADNFPIRISGVDNFMGTPLLADYTGDGNAEIIAFSDDGRIFALTSAGDVVPGFPISTGASPNVVPVIFNSLSISSLMVASVGVDNFLSIWALSSEPKEIFWSSQYSDAGNRNSSEPAGQSAKISKFFPEARAYNYPNPVHSGETYFRFYVSEDALYEIKVFDLSGAYVAGLSGEADGGLDTEVPWNVSEIESGIYFAHISVTGIGGKSAFKNIKVAVSK